MTPWLRIILVEMPSCWLFIERVKVSIIFVLKCLVVDFYWKRERDRYSVFRRFREAKFDNGGSILSSSQFSLLP
jgi:hypothetical protein